LTGVGPGDENLITKSAIDYIKKADAIIYDHLVPVSVLDYAKKGAKLIYAGKSPGKHSMPQEKINRLLKKEVKNNKIALRLKGGDPFLFGRGAEEALHLKKSGIEFEVIPGVSAGSAVPSYAGIPLTQRGISSQVTFVTGHEDEKKHNLSVNWEKLAKSDGTLVIFMGMMNLECIVNKLVSGGMDKNTPVCVIQRGTTPRQKSVMATLSNIVKKVYSKKISNPAIVVVGKVVSLRKKLNWYESKPLFGKKILITRPGSLAKEFALKLRQLGAQTRICPLIELSREKKLKPGNLANKIAITDWIIFTSRNAVDICFELLKACKKDARVFSKTKIAAIGDQTKNMLLERGLMADVVPKEFSMEGLANEFKKIELKGKKIFFPHSLQGRKLLCEKLHKQGAIIEEMFIYRIKKTKALNSKKLINIIREEKFDWITFTSSSCVHAFMRFLKRRKRLIKKQRFACIGPVTNKTLKSYGVGSNTVAKVYTIEGLIGALVNKGNYQR